MAECLVSIHYIEYCESYNLYYKIVIFNLCLGVGVKVGV